MEYFNKKGMKYPNLFKSTSELFYWSSTLNTIIWRTHHFLPKSKPLFIAPEKSRCLVWCSIFAK